jgi:hypothetical protein
MSLSSRVFHRLFLSCRQASELISQAQDVPLGPLQRLRLALHLAACDYCRRFSRQLDVLRDSMRRYRS